MLQNFISDRIKEQLPFEPTPEQERLIALFGAFLTSTDREKIFILKGYAGTGKTTVVSALVRALNGLKQKTVLLAPTGRAAKVLSLYSGFSALTIHKKIFRQKSISEFKFKLADNLYSDTLFIVDEASMIQNATTDSVFGSGSLLDDLIEYVYSGNNCSLLLIGDIAQLPPVMQPFSPALDTNTIKNYALTPTEFSMIQVVRQAQNSGILYNATLLRNSIEDEKVDKYPTFELDGFSDIRNLAGTDFLEEIQHSINQVGLAETIVVTRSNKNAIRYNDFIRSRVMMKEEELSNGDLLMVTQNNYFWNKPYPEIDFIANGEILEIVRIKKYRNMYGYRFVDLTLRSVDYNWDIDARIWLDTIHAETPKLCKEMTNKLFETVMADYADLTNKKQKIKKVMENEYFNSLQVKYAYAITCHKAQGGQWKKVFIDHGTLFDGQVDIDFYRWYYTALTRASETVYLLNAQKR